jgi:uncharacterized protein YeaC (DUF1315 family)
VNEVTAIRFSSFVSGKFPEGQAATEEEKELTACLLEL